MKNYKHEARKVSDLIPYINNARIHSEEQVKQICASNALIKINGKEVDWFEYKELN